MNQLFLTRLQKNSLWLALLLHLLMFFSLSYVWVTRSQSNENPMDYIESFAYQEPPSPVSQNNAALPPKPQNKTPVSKNGILKPIPAVREMRFNQVVDISSPKNSEPVHLIGDNKKTPKPLIILLAKAMTAKLLYPKAAIDLTVKGVSVIGFVLYPDGQVKEVRLLKSSGADILDQAALAAANEISPIPQAGTYIKEPEPIVFGIIFGGRQ